MESHLEGTAGQMYETGTGPAPYAAEASVLPASNNDMSNILPNPSRSFLNPSMDMGPHCGGIYGGATLVPMMGHPGITNVLFSFQSLVFSLGQTIQIVSMNSRALSHIFKSSKQMLEYYCHNIVEMKEKLEEFVISFDAFALIISSKPRSADDEVSRRRKLKAIRWTMTLALTIGGYKVVRYTAQWWMRRKQQYHQVEAASQWTNGGKHDYSDHYSNNGPPLTNQHLGYSNPPGVNWSSRQPSVSPYPQRYGGRSYYQPL